MKKKINTQFIIVSFIAIILTMSLSVGTFYELFVQEMRNDMKAYTHVLRSAGVFNASNEEKLNLKNEDLRITIIDADGTVVYDNEANDIEMDNHKDRPEIESALKNGEGSDVRKSSTLNKSTYYYAVLLDDGQVLRIAKEASSVWNIFIKVLPLILGIIILMLFSVGIITHYITKSIVKPVEELANNIDEIKDIKTYKEIQPFIDTIKKQHEDIVKNSHVRQEFTANVSHELKTPLTSMKVLADSINCMGDEAPVEMYREFMGDITNEIDRETKIINDLLSLVKMDKSAADLNITSVNINDLLEQILKRLQPIADKQQVELVLESFRPVTAEIDEVKLTLAFTNLIENAIKYNDNESGGWVHVSLNADHQYFYLKVEDNGIGIPEESLEHIYERFYRVDKSHSREIGGTGLGLAITRSSILMHRGAIKAHSVLGEGTTFDVRIPLNYIA